MTTDYKRKLLRWFTGKYTEQTGQNEPQFNAVETTNSGFKSAIQTAFPNGYDIIKVIQTKDGKGNGTNNTIVVGYEAANPIKGFILIMDEEYNIIKTFRKYNDGSDIRMFLSVNIDEKGCLYGIEGDDYNTNLKLVLMNNITAIMPDSNDYVLVKKASYAANGVAIENIKKAPNKDIYTTVDTKLSEMRINGNNLNITNYSVGNGVYIFDYIPSWDNQNNFSMNGIGVGNSNKYYNIKSDGTTTLQTTQLSVTASSYGSNAFMVDNGNTYIINADTNTSSYFNYDVYKVSGNTATKIHTDTCQWTSVYGLMPSFYDIKSENAFFYVLEDFDAANPTKNVFKLRQIIDDEVYGVDLGETTYDSNNPLLAIGNCQNQFNLYEINFQADNTLFKVSEIYNYLNYNGVPYRSFDSMIPNSVNMYDENDKPIFARNLYDLTVIDNTTTSTVVIPNSFLNNIPIYLKELVSKTANVMAENSGELEKNIYEEVFVNFSNSIIIKNNLVPTSPTYSDLGATRLNNSVSRLKDYDTAKLGKYRVNYSDGTSQMYNLTQISNFANISTTMKLLVGVPANKDIKSIDLMSNDGNTIYQTITNLNLTRDKIYILEQKVEVL